MKRMRSRTSTKETYTPSELAAEVGISADALRFYERKVLLPAAPRNVSGRRVFSPSALQRVRVIRAALSLGFTVAELREVFRIRDSGGAPCHTVMEMACAKLVELEETIAQLSATRNVLAKSMRTWRRKIHTAAPGARSGLLDLFAQMHPERSRQLSPRIGAGLRHRMRKFAVHPAKSAD